MVRRRRRPTGLTPHRRHGGHSAGTAWRPAETSRLGAPKGGRRAQRAQRARQERAVERGGQGLASRGGAEGTAGREDGLDGGAQRPESGKPSGEARLGKPVPHTWDLRCLGTAQAATGGRGQPGGPGSSRQDGARGRRGGAGWGRGRGRRTGGAREQKGRGEGSRSEASDMCPDETGEKTQDQENCTWRLLRAELRAAGRAVTETRRRWRHHRRARRALWEGGRNV